MDKKRDISLEDILLEHEIRKGSEKQAPPKKETPAAPAASTSDTSSAPSPVAEKFLHPDRAKTPQPPRSAVDVFRAPPTVRKAPAKTIPPAIDEIILQTEAARKAKERERQALEAQREERRAIQKKKEEDTRRLPSMQPAEEQAPKTVAVSMRTRLLSVPQEEEKALHDTHELSGHLEGQLVMEQFVEEPIDEEKLEQELLRRRREKVKEFRIVEGGKAEADVRKPSFKLVGDEEESDATEEVLPEQEEEEIPEDLLEDFNEYAEADAIRSELAYRRRTGAFGLIATLVMEAVLLLLTILYQAGWLNMMMPSVLVALHVAVSVGMLCVNYRMIGGGLKGLFRFRADADTPPALCGVLGLLYTVVQFAWTDAIANGQAVFLSAAAGIGVLAGACGRQTQIVRIRRNFGFVGQEKQPKYAATILDDVKTAQNLGYEEGVDGIPPIVYYRRVSFLEQFLDTSYASDPADRVMRWFAPLVLGVSLLCAVGYTLLFPGQYDHSLLLFVSTVLLCMPVWSMFAVQRTMTRSCKRALRKGALIGGFAAAESFGSHPKTVILEAAQLFPQKQVKLHGIKTFSGTRIDEAITDAAAVMIAAKGPLSPIFHRLIENRTDILREVDSLAYEQDMGLSGWVGGRRVLIGNRRLLENHGVEVPSKEYEERYVRDERHVVYLSTGGELSAMFVVSYLASEAIKAQLRALEREHIRLTVRTCDPNITGALIAEVMELSMGSVDVLSAGEGRVYESLINDRTQDRAAAVLAGGGHAVSQLFAVVQSCRLRRAAWAALISQVALSIAAMLFCVFICATTGVVFRTSILMAVMAGCGAIGWLVGRLFRA